MTKYRASAIGLTLLAATSVAIVQAQANESSMSNAHRAQATAPSRSQTAAVHELQRAAQRLRDAIQAMAQQPVGPQRDYAMREANKALIDTQTAMTWMYDDQLARASASRGANVASAADARGSVSSRAGGSVGAGADPANEASDVSAVAGGVGINARARFSNEAAPDHNVKMVFALDTGNYVADVHVKVNDAAGRTVIEGVAKGPWLYARLPAGTYTASATYAGHTVTEELTIGRSGRRTAYFRWPASVEQQAVAGVSPLLGTGPQEPQGMR